MTNVRVAVIAAGLVLLAGCHRSIELRTLPLAGPPPSFGPPDVVAYAERAGGLQAIHGVALPEGDLDYRFAIVNHASYHAPILIVRVTRQGSKVRGEAWCHQSFPKPPDQPWPAPERAALARTARVDWNAVLRRLEVLELSTWRFRGPPRRLSPGEGPSDDPYAVIEGRDASGYHALGMPGVDSISRHNLGELHRIALEVWGTEGRCFGERGAMWPNTTAILPTHAGRH